MHELRLRAQAQLADELPPRIDPERATVAQVVVADRKTLRVVAQLVLAQQSERAGEPDLHAEIDEHVFEPARALEAVVDQLAVAAERVSEQQHDGGARDVERERGGLNVNAPPTMAAAAMPRNQHLWPARTTTSPSHTCATSRWRMRCRARLSGSARAATMGQVALALRRRASARDSRFERTGHRAHLEREAGERVDEIVGHERVQHPLAVAARCAPGPRFRAPKGAARSPGCSSRNARPAPWWSSSAFDRYARISRRGREASASNMRSSCIR